jgi:hypothetical protein
MDIEGRTGQRLRPLTKTELDRSMQRLADELALAPEPAVLDDEPVPGLRPRWISAAELVRRVSPFTGRN